MVGEKKKSRTGKTELESRQELRDVAVSFILGFFPFSSFLISIIIISSKDKHPVIPSHALVLE